MTHASALDALAGPVAARAGARPTRSGRVEVRHAVGGGHTQALCTARPRRDGTLGAVAAECWRDLAEAMAAVGLAPLQERIYGRLEARPAILAARRAALTAAGLDPDTPVTFHQGLPIDRDDFAGVQVWGVAPRGPEVTITTTPRGRLWQGPDYRVLHVPGVHGRGPGGTDAAGVAVEAEQMFLAAEQAVTAEGFDFRDVRRTWITMRRILDWYGEFNRVRNAFFAARGVGADERRSFPASTGIQGTSAGEECAMDLLAAAGPGVCATPVRTTSRQDGAFDYGSAFSRAMRLELDGVHAISISGTASIDAAGASLYAGCAQAQILETLLCIGALLDGVGAGLADIGLATLFCKTPEVCGAYREAARLLGLPDLPVVPVVADVCRPELLVEIEALAFVPASAKECPA